MKKIPLLFVLLAIALTACSQKAHLYFYPEERWKVNTTIMIDSQVFQFASQIINEGISEYLPFELPDEIMDPSTYLGMGLDVLLAQYGSQGIDANWHRSGNSYSIKLEGKNFDQFSELIPGAITIAPVSDGENQYHLNIYFGDWNVIAAPLYQQTIVLHAGKIISSNAVKMTGGTATWRNPAEIDVVFVPATLSISPIFLWVIGGFLSIGIIIVLVMNFRSKTCPICGARLSSKADCCSECGADILPGVDI